MVTAVEEVHTSYVDQWQLALSSGDTSGVELFLGPDYHGWFCPDSAESFPYDRDEGVEGMRESVRRLRGCAMEAAHRMVSRRGDAEALVFYEKRILRQGAVLSRAVILEAWRLHDDGRWLLLREVTEHGAGSDVRGTR
ncbi:hypothetical protein GCM10009844_44340 [Nocardioides koreensis]|uniref:Nuclear transport factor 2 family protein n=1 Tax=Nocardioides koreensis TaxID=433651 RepID=A0ABN3A953_9ACTN